MTEVVYEAGIEKWQRRKKRKIFLDSADNGRSGDNILLTVTEPQPCFQQTTNVFHFKMFSMT